MYDIFRGGGNSNIFDVHPKPWGNNPFWLSHIFQMGWGKTTNQICLHLLWKWSNCKYNLTIPCIHQVFGIGHTLILRILSFSPISMGECQRLLNGESQSKGGNRTGHFFSEMLGFVNSYCLFCTMVNHHDKPTIWENISLLFKKAFGANPRMMPNRCFPMYRQMCMSLKCSSRTFQLLMKCFLPAMTAWNRTISFQRSDASASLFVSGLMLTHKELRQPQMINKTQLTYLNINLLGEDFSMPRCSEK